MRPSPQHSHKSPSALRKARSFWRSTVNRLAHVLSLGELDAPKFSHRMFLIILRSCEAALRLWRLLLGFGFKDDKTSRLRGNRKVQTESTEGSTGSSCTQVSVVLVV